MELIKSLYKQGPHAIGMKIGDSFQYEGEGVYDGSDCEIMNDKDMNHAVLVVGYNMTGKNPHWIVRNSWGSHVHDDGYFKIKMGENACNTEVVWYYPIVE